MDESLRTTGLIKAESLKLVDLAKPTIEPLSGSYSIELGDNGDLFIEWPKYPDETKLEEASDVKDISLKKGDEVIVAATGKCLFDYTKLYGPIRYMADIFINGSNIDHVVTKDDNYSRILDLDPGDQVAVEIYYGYKNGDTTSNKARFEQKADLSFTVPDRDSSRDRVESWASRYGFIDFVVEQTSTLSDINTFMVTDGSNRLEYGATYHVTDSSARYTCTYYVEKDHTLNVAVAYGNDDNRSVSLSPSFDEGSTFDRWEYSDSLTEDFEFTQDGNKLTIRAREGISDQDITVKAFTDKKSYELTLSVRDGRFQ